MKEAVDFLAESESLYQLTRDTSAEFSARETQFKGWSIDDIIGHLHLWNVGADLSLCDPAAFDRHVSAFWQAIKGGESRQSYTSRWSGCLTGARLRETWRDFFIPMSARFVSTDSKQRVRWIGPDMSVRTSITARLMETWAHGQAIYDLLGIERISSDAIRSIAQLGVNTRAWTFTNRALQVPAVAPFIELHAPSGQIWTWNEENDVEVIRGSAMAFCQIVTQTRNVADTTLNIAGTGAKAWMSMAQCFAGAPEAPPAPGTRYRFTGPGHSRAPR